MVTAAEFLDPGGAAGLPECLEETLGDLAGARALAANARGSLLAGAGRGGCAVWDLSTRGVVRRPGAGAAAAVEWTRDGRRLMVAGGDGAVKLVDVESGEVQVAVDLGFPIIGASLEPDGRVCVAWGAVGPPTFCDLRTRDTCRMRLPSLDAKADIAKSDGLRFVARFPQQGGGGFCSQAIPGGSCRWWDTAKVALRVRAKVHRWERGAASGTSRCLAAQRCVGGPP